MFHAGFRYLVVAAALLLGGALAALAQDQERRVALVIGNGAYEHVVPLRNPANDATDMADELEQLGFEVVRGIDLTMDAFGETLGQFAEKVRGAKVALLFYAGHGLQVDGKNYVLPVDTEIERRSDLDFEAVQVDRLIEIMDENADLTLVFLDACRDNPLTRSLARSTAVPAGLAPMEVGTGSYIAFATAPGNAASDGRIGARNSPFTAALLRNIARPDLDIRLMMSDVRAEVFETTEEEQRPWENNSLIGRFYFKQTPLEGPEAEALAEKRAFETALSDGTAAALESFLETYPDSRFAGPARQALDLVQEAEFTSVGVEEALWRTVRDSVLPAEFRLYLDLFPNGEYRDLAEDRLVAIERAVEVQDDLAEGDASREGLRRAALERATELPISFVQYGLIALGYPIADPAGVLDAATRQAIRAYQASIGAQQTGRLSPWQTVEVVLKAAAVGDEHAETAIGIMTASGLGLPRDDRLARMWLTRAAEDGQTYAQANLALLYRDGRGGPRDLPKARALLEQALAGGLADAQPLLDSLDG